MLTPKFTPAEIDAIKELSMQRQENTDSGLEEPRDWLTKTSSCFLFCSYSSNNRIKDRPAVTSLWKLMCTRICQSYFSVGRCSWRGHRGLCPHGAPSAMLTLQPGASSGQWPRQVGSGSNAYRRVRFDEITASRYCAVLKQIGNTSHLFGGEAQSHR